MELTTWELYRIIDYAERARKCWDVSDAMDGRCLPEERDYLQRRARLYQDTYHKMIADAEGVNDWEIMQEIREYYSHDSKPFAEDRDDYTGPDWNHVHRMVDDLDDEEKAPIFDVLEDLESLMEDLKPEQREKLTGIIRGILTHH